MKELFFHQISLKTFKILIHRNALLDSLHELFQLGRNLYFVANDVLHCFQELCRMSRFKENTGLSRLQTFRKGTITASSVRVRANSLFPDRLPSLLHESVHLYRSHPEISIAMAA